MYHYLLMLLQFLHPPICTAEYYVLPQHTQTEEASSVQLEEVLPEDDSRQRQSTGTGRNCCWTVFKTLVG